LFLTVHYMFTIFSNAENRSICLSIASQLRARYRHLSPHVYFNFRRARGYDFDPSDLRLRPVADSSEHGFFFRNPILFDKFRNITLLV
jgi:hypothetical protein